MDKIAFCGHHCGFCFFDQCPGCRSDNAFCSFATLFEDKKCPNVKCCIEKGFGGIKYPNQLNEMEDVNKMVGFLEKYLRV
jgi:hypothetical protein